MRSVTGVTGSALIAMADRLDGDPIQWGNFGNEPYAMQTSVIMAQIISHATEHRSHVQTTLSSHGMSPPAEPARATDRVHLYPTC